MPPLDSYNVVLSFGKHRGMSLGVVYDIDPGYVRWLSENKNMPGNWPIAARRLLAGESLQDLILPRQKEHDLQALDIHMWVVKNKTIGVTFSYDRDLLERFKFEVDGRKWNNDDKYWTFDAVQLPKAVELFGGPQNIQATDDVKQLWRDERSRRRDLDQIRVKDDSDIKIKLDKLLKLPLYNFQNVAVDFVNRANGRAMVADSMGLGKAQPLDAKILTPTGWISMGDVSMGTDVITPNNKISTVINVYPQGKKDIYKVWFSDKTYVECCADHLWAVRSSHGKYANTDNEEIKTVRELQHDLVDGQHNFKWSVPLTDPIKFITHKPLPAHPYLLGIPNMMGIYLCENGIPPIYMTASVSDRISLFQGLMDTSGWYSDTLRFGSTSEILVGQVKELVESFGGTACFDSNRKFYVITISLPPTILPFKSNDKLSLYKAKTTYVSRRYITNIEFSRRSIAQCIELDKNGPLYITDNYTVTHNTATSIGYASLHNLKTLIVCPKSIVIGWKREIERFTGKQSTIWETDSRVGRIDQQFHIINYDITERYISALRAANFDLLVCDEATMLKNRRTIRAKSVLGDYKQRKLYPGIKTKHVLFLTGTPVMNRPIEAFSLLNFLDNKRFNNFFQFTQKYGGWRGEEPRNLGDLHDRTKDLIIRRLKKDILTELPDKQRNNLYVELTPSEYKEYDDLLRKLFRRWRVKGKPTVAEMPAIQQYLNNKKIPRLIEMADELLEQDRGLLVYSCFIDPLLKLKAHYGDKAVLLYGQMSQKERQKSIDALKSGEAKIGLFSIGAGALGIDGLQYSIDTVAFLDHFWVPSIHEQAEDRIFRIGQIKQAQIYYFVVESSIDEYMSTLLREKQRMIDQIVDGSLITGEKTKSIFRDFVKLIRQHHNIGSDVGDPTSDTAEDVTKLYDGVVSDGDVIE